MKYLKTLGLAAVAAAALLAFAGTATANPLTSPEGTPYTSTIKAESEGKVEIDGPYIEVRCDSTLEGKVETHSSTTVGGKVASLTFTACNFAAEVLKPGSLEIHANGNGTATVTSSGAEIKASTSIGTCVFQTNATDIGTLKASNLTGGSATLDLTGAKIPRTSGSFLCGEFGTLTGSYKVTTPSTLYVD